MFRKCVYQSTKGCYKVSINEDGSKNVNKLDKYEYMCEG